MKQLKYIALLLTAVSVVTSCSSDYLEPVPDSGITADAYFNNANEVETGVIAIYDAWQGVNDNDLSNNHSVQYEFYLTEMRSDNTRTKSQEGEAAQFEFYNVEATNGIVGNYYASMYSVIFRSNIVLENLGVVTDANLAASFEAEAKFNRALAYFNLVRLYGDVPLVDKVITPLDTETQYTRVATSTIYDLIVSDLTTAIDGLDNTYKTRASRAAAQGILAKVQLTLGNYSEAQSLCEAVMASGFSLQPNFNDIFYNERNSEIIFAIGYESALSSDSQNFSAEWMNGVGRTAGVNYVTDDVITALTDFGGDRTQYSFRNDPSQTSQNQVTKYLPNGEDGGADGKTFVNDATLAGNDWIVLRYADVLLMHAEAILAGGNETTDAAALASFQMVRDRAGLPTTVTIITKDALLLERRVELAFENQRLFDLIRFGRAEAVLSAFSAANGLGYTTSDLLLPIPQREINLSKGAMSQNPGY
ncbi:RagB/SusD family nutrient uptake outer membrane protein [Seonamhaeicola marinus]|uniref:RagB/SusD family nutrient uptake outer membrane protein n=1 Tax=Seonamhaeicola marinus TaxID=1912246 RepID=A0A5D0I3U5_9FLAO|nr:RagB/SusD family nutrient uptake outer membrane protein [Seonamhaeicola marinus]TYA78373.1 RagB/SusD family nutrient uptake outer membrane protein [Seonamhaeicola marinus]